MRSRAEPLRLAVLCLVFTLGSLGGLDVSAANTSEVAGFTYDESFNFASAEASGQVDLTPTMLIGDVIAAPGELAGGHLRLASDLVAPRSSLDDVLAVCRRSFRADTEVLLGDGTTTRPISELEVGDEVWATDPETGESGPWRVEAVWPHFDWLLHLDVDGGSVTTTEDHHFWNATDREWQESQQLDRGDRLLTASGSQVAAGSLDWSTRHYDEAYDLTIAGVHSYFVEAGDEDVLVHNCGPLGSGGTQTTSKTLLKPRGRNFRIDVENPAPGVRAGQLHLQSGSNRYLYDFSTNQFVGLPRSLAGQIANDPGVAAAIAKGRTYLNVQP